MKRLSIAAIATILILSISLTYAAFLLTRTVTNNVVILARADFKVYSDAACTLELTTVDYPPMFRGDSRQKAMWMKNLGETTVYVQWANVNLPTDTIYAINFDGSGWNSGVRNAITAGQIISCTSFFTIGASTPFGAKTFDLVLTVHDSAT